MDVHLYEFNQTSGEHATAVIDMFNFDVHPNEKMSVRLNKKTRHLICE